MYGAMVVLPLLSAASLQEVILLPLLILTDAQLFVLFLSVSRLLTYQRIAAVLMCPATAALTAQQLLWQAAELLLIRMSGAIPKRPRLSAVLHPVLIR